MYGPGFWVGDWRWQWSIHQCNWWNWATARSVTAWLTAAINRPIYIDYGNNLYYQDEQVFYQGQAIATAEEYGQQAKEIAASIPKDIVPDEVEWLPLGVFALTQKDGAAEDSTLFLQLAISKEGIIAGTFQNAMTEESFEVEGTIDQESQRAAWGPVGKEWPIMETGIYNLTENESGALLHFESEGHSTMDTGSSR